MIQKGYMELMAGKDRNRRRNSVVRFAALLAMLFAWRAGMAQSGGNSTTATTTGAIALTNTASTTAGLTDEPIYPGEVVHVTVYDAPDFSTVTHVSSSGDIGLPYVGIVHLQGLNSASAGELITKVLRDAQMVNNPHVLVTVESSSMAITVLGEVRQPGVFLPPGKRQLSDLLAMAGGVTANAGRVIEISNAKDPEKKELIPWDPTMHNTDIYDHLIDPGARILVKPCGFVYVTGNVGRPGAYAHCQSKDVSLAQIVAVAGSAIINSVDKKVALVRRNDDGTRVVRIIDLHKIEIGKQADVTVEDGDVVFVPFSRVKQVASSIPGYLVNFTTTAMNVRYF